jgi:hypothetical protein
LRHRWPLARRLREELNARFGDEWAVVLDLLAEVRGGCHQPGEVLARAGGRSGGRLSLAVCP